MVKDIYQKPIDNIILNTENCFPPKIGSRQECVFVLIICIRNCMAVLASEEEREGRKEGRKTEELKEGWREEGKKEKRKERRKRGGKEGWKRGTEERISMQ